MKIGLIKFIPCSMWAAWRLGIQWRPGLWFIGLPYVRRQPRSKIIFKGSAKVVSGMRYNEIGLIQRTMFSLMNEGAVIEIGDNVGMSGVTLSARERISIGQGTSLGSGVLIMDNDAHSIEVNARLSKKPVSASPVRIGDYCFVGARAIILKGVTMGEGAVVGAGSVVTKDVEPYEIVAGNPARKIGEVKRDET